MLTFHSAPVKLELTAHHFFRHAVVRSRQLSEVYVAPNPTATSTSPNNVVVHSKFKNVTRSDNVALHNYQDIVYTTPVRIQQSDFLVQIDTGSSDLWVSCAAFAQQDLDPSIPCDASNSLTNSTANCSTIGGTLIKYGSGNVCVLPNSAQIQFGRVEIANYMVGIAQGANVMPDAQDPILSGGAQGILGLAYRSIASIPSPNGQFIDQISNFSINLQAAVQPPASESSGSTDGTTPTISFMILNGVDQEFITQNNLTGIFVPLKSASHWTIALGQVVFGDQVLTTPCTQPNNGFCNAILDTGTSLVSMPPRVFDMFVQTYLQTCTILYPESTIYACDQAVVHQLPTIGFTLGSQETGWTNFQLTPQDYTMLLESTSGQEVMIELQANPQGLSSTWILGDTFLRAYYSLYQVDQGVTLYCPTGKCLAVHQVVRAQNTSSSNGNWYQSGVVWGILGGTAFGLVVALGWLFWRQRRRHQHHKRHLVQTDDCMNQHAMLVQDTNA